MKLIFIFPVVLVSVSLVHFLQVVEIVRTLGIDTFMENEMLALFFCH